MIRNSKHYQYYCYNAFQNLIRKSSSSGLSTLSNGNSKNCSKYFEVNINKPINAINAINSSSRRQISSLTMCHGNTTMKKRLKVDRDSNNLRSFNTWSSCFPPRSSKILHRDIYFDGHINIRLLSKSQSQYSRLYSCVLNIKRIKKGLLLTDDHIKNNNNNNNNKTIINSSSSSSTSSSSSITNIKKKKTDKMGLFRFSDYDCIGFDLDNTLLRYNIRNMVTLEYEALSKFMVEDRGYDGRYLSKELEPRDYDFMQKGLIIDFERGNILRLSPNGFILRASHGSNILNDDEIAGYYPDGKWEVTSAFTSDFLVTWNGPLSEKMRTLLDYFDMPASVVFARVIDTLDEIERENDQNADYRKKIYSVWPDVLDGLIHMFDRDNFSKNKGRYFSTLKSNPQKFMHKSSPELVSWLKELKKTKLTYLITGSNADFADFTASYALGKNWRSLFDVIICYAKKPGFFTGSRPFLKVESDYKETSVITVSGIKRGEIYSQGNWKELKEYFSKECGKKSPSCLYVGDNLIQDIYTPKHYADCDTVAIVEEQLAEGMLDHNLSHKDEEVLNSKVWGSYFHIKDNKTNQLKATLWSHVINNYSKICLPSVDFIVQNSLDTPLKSFGIEEERKLSGYHPAKPKTVAIL